MAENVREPVVAGQFYPGASDRLRREVESYIDRGTARERAIGAVVPHAGYVYSGEVAGAVYARLERTGSYVILGPNHTGMGAEVSVWAKGLWRTPLGDVPVAEDLAAGIIGGCAVAREDEAAHLREYSIEVQLPFLQATAKEFEFVPIVVSDVGLREFRHLGRAIAGAIRGSSTPVTILATSDMTHRESAGSAKKKDDEALSAVSLLDEELLVSKVHDLDISMCGYAPTAVMLVAAKELGAKVGTLVRYMTSGDRTGDMSSVVGYAGVIVK